MGLLRTYDPKQVVVNIAGFSMSGFADGTFVKIERNADMFTKHIGADGEVSRAKSNDRSGMLTLTLAQTSPSNAVLSGLAAVDEVSSNGVVPVIVTDLSGVSAYFAAQGWIRKAGDVEYGNEVGSIEWTIDLAVISVMFHGGNAGEADSDVPEGIDTDLNAAVSQVKTKLGID